MVFKLLLLGLHCCDWHYSCWKACECPDIWVLRHVDHVLTVGKPWCTVWGIWANNCCDTFVLLHFWDIGNPIEPLLGKFVEIVLLLWFHVFQVSRHPAVVLARKNHIYEISDNRIRFVNHHFQTDWRKQSLTAISYITINLKPILIRCQTNVKVIGLSPGHFVETEGNNLVS